MQRETMIGSPRRPRLHLAIELAIVGAFVLAMSLYALWRMDYLDPATAHEVRMTDSTRTAYVAKNIVEGNGYTTNELPAYLLDFYHDRGKLDDAHWVNADRFPFTAYAVAALYVVTGSTGYEVGILGYNLVCFVGFLVLLYWLVRAIWNDRWSAMFALAIALLHPLTYVYLYLKDADMMLLAAGIMLGYYRYLEAPAGTLSWKRSAGFGTLLGWMLLARPNIGMAFILFFGLVVLHRLWTRSREVGLARAVATLARCEGVIAIGAAIWCVPFVIHSMSEWGEPLFSANAIYQRPLGTRFAMQTDTWWKYSDPDQAVTLQTLIEGAPDQLRAKFTTSWLATLKTTVGTWGMEFCLAFGLLGYLARRLAAAGAGPDAAAPASGSPEHARRVRNVAGMVGFAVLINFLVLPLYGWQGYGYRHYLSFFLPLIWLLSGRAVALVAEQAGPAVAAVREHVRAHRSLWLAGALLAFTYWNFGARDQIYNQLFVTTGRFIAKHWLISCLLAIVLVWPRILFGGRTLPRVAIVLGLLVFGRYTPNLEIKGNNLSWFPADPKVWDVLRERKGLVMSLAMQGEVNWVSDRRNIPAPENVLHTYSLRFDHGLEVEDLYIESADITLDPSYGVFHYSAPGFESYQRMQRHQGRLPGYQLVFHAESEKGNPRFKLRARPKASTVWRLVDRDAAIAMGRSPDRIELGNVANIVYTTHGWGEYYTLEGKPAVAATDVSRRRYQYTKWKPYEDSSVSFFLDDRRPTSLDLEVYATHPTTLELFWNLDLYAYDRAKDRPAHALGTHKLTRTGWQRIHIELPPGITRKGLNKLGFRASGFVALDTCALDPSAAGCSLRLITGPSSSSPPIADPADGDVPAAPERPDVQVVAAPVGERREQTSLFAGTLELHYDPTPPLAAP
jgi:hypothetical protein